MTIKLKPNSEDIKPKTLRRKNLTVEEKVALFEDYMDNIGGPIESKTVYKGLPIGTMLMQMRSNISLNRVNYSDDIIKRLNKIGLLDKKLETLDEKIDRLEKYCENNLQIWCLRTVLYREYAKSDETYLSGIPLVSSDEMRDFLDDHKLTPVFIDDRLENGEIPIDIVIQELNRSVRDYIYIRDRYRKGKLTNEQVKKLKDAGVGGVFENKTEIEELSEKTGIDVNRLKQIVIDFGSLENFRKLYINFMLSWDVWKEENTFGFNTFDASQKYIMRIFGSVKRFNNFKKHFRYLAKINKVVTFFDLSQEGFIPTEENRTLSYIVGLEYILGSFFDKKGLDNAQTNFNSQESSIINELTENKGATSFSDIAREHHVSKTRIMQIKNRIARKIINQTEPSVWSTGINDTRRKRFIRKYFSTQDIFITEDSFVLPQKLKLELLKIIGAELTELENESLNQTDLNTELGELITDLRTAYRELEQSLEISQEMDDVQMKSVPEEMGI